VTRTQEFNTQSEPIWFANDFQVKKLFFD